MYQFFQSIADRLLVLFDPEALGAATADFLANLIIGLATFLAYYFLWRVLDFGLRAVTNRVTVDRTTREFSRTILKFAVLTLGVVNALAAVGVNTASLIASLGIAGLTIGFAARDALSNLISGLLIYWDRPFVIGDLLEIGSHYGKVEKITLRSTRVVTPDGRMLAIPNTEIINSTVASYTNFPHLRIEVPVTVGVAEDLDRVRETLLGLVRDESDYMTEPPPKVAVRSLNDYNVEVALTAWVYDERRHRDLCAQLREAVFKEFTQVGIEMPFETLSIQPIELKRAVG
jgi:small conductance mechanosensitive channel